MSSNETSVQRRNLPNPYPMKLKCSKLLNLKTDVGTTNKKVHNQMSEEIRFEFCSIVLDKTELEKKSINENSPQRT